MKKTDFNEIIDFNGIIYRKEESCQTKAEIICNPPESPIDLSELPFPYADLEIQKDGTKQLIPNTLIKDLEHRIIYYESSRDVRFPAVIVCPQSKNICVFGIWKL